jgi:hypothetical protein
MNDDLTQARHLVELGYLENIANELGMPTQLIERGPEMPYHTLLVDLDPEAAENNKLHMAVTFYPVADDQLDETLLLQYYIALPATFAEGGLDRVREWLPELNNKTALGHFGLTDDHSQLHFRYVQALSLAGGITREAVGEVLVLVAYTPAVFAGPLAGLAAGTLTLEAARAQVAARFGG